MEASGDEKVVSSLGRAGEAYNPCRRVPRKAFSCTHLQLKQPGNTNCHTTYQESFERYLPSPTPLANNQLFLPDITPKYTPLSSATQIPSVRFLDGGFQTSPPGNTLILKSWCFGKLQRLRTSHYTLGNIRANKSRSVKQHTLMEFLKHPESFVCHWTSVFLKHHWFPPQSHHFCSSLPPRKNSGLLFHLFNLY